MKNQSLQSKVILKDNYLIVEFSEPYHTLSWAILNGGKAQTSEVVWHQVRDKDLGEDVNPYLFIKDRFSQYDNAVGLLTSANIKDYVDVCKSLDDYSARCIATVGLSNALRTGDPPGTVKSVGTINILVQLSMPLSEQAFIEAMSIATEARTLAILESRTPSIQTSLPATGTGTDCIVIAAPVSQTVNHYAGKHTAIGSLIGSVVYEAIYSGAQIWRAKGESEYNKNKISD